MPTGDPNPLDRQLSRWSWSVQRAAARKRARQRRLRLSRGSGAALLALGIGLPLPLVYEFTIGDQQARDQAAQVTAGVERGWSQAAAASKPSAGPTAGPSSSTVPSPTATAAHGLTATGSYPQHYAEGQAFAVLHVPAIGLDTAIAEGTDTTTVLDHGLIGHYSGAQETAFPWQGLGNFALAAHRTTHGAPFNRLAELKPGDEAVVETADEFFVYAFTGGIPQVATGDVGVLAPIPAGSGFTAPGRYLTLTTCTPEYSSAGRLIRFGQLVKVVPRSAQPTGIPGL
ncbi:sortase A [Kitasatospora sp. GAS204A]|uniref:class E sortase n=1 Tax=unclassified Kitasatospora TaxID=2633591 RepID=UPI00247665F9|nr:class E sortase [Kitasatospora sp. GAS204B]MDH6116800.1 sortase A [Kitasatospora sp. GAS204B]